MGEVARKQGVPERLFKPCTIEENALPSILRGRWVGKEVTCEAGFGRNLRDEVCC